MMRLALHLRAGLLLWLSHRAVARSRRYDRRSVDALARARIWTAAAARTADRLDRLRREQRACPPGDLLHGSRAIAAHLGVPKATAVHLIRSEAIPTFALAGVACARRSTLAKHFARLEACERP